MLFFFRRPTKCTTVIYETLDTLTEALEAFTIRLSFVDRQTDKSKDQPPKQHHYLGRKNNHFSRMGPEKGKKACINHLIKFFPYKLCNHIFF